MLLRSAKEQSPQQQQWKQLSRLARRRLGLPCALLGIVLPAAVALLLRYGAADLLRSLPAGLDLSLLVVSACLICAGHAAVALFWTGSHAAAGDGQNSIDGATRALQLSAYVLTCLASMLIALFVAYLFAVSDASRFFPVLAGFMLWMIPVSVLLMNQLVAEPGTGHKKTQALWFKILVLASCFVPLAALCLEPWNQILSLMPHWSAVLSAARSYAPGLVPGLPLPVLVLIYLLWLAAAVCVLRHSHSHSHSRGQGLQV